MCGSNSFGHATHTIMNHATCYFTDCANRSKHFSKFGDDIKGGSGMDLCHG